MPACYYGFDKNWEDGLSIGREKYADDLNKSIFFFEISQSEQIIYPRPMLDLAVCMETLEHIPPEKVGKYIEKIASLKPKYFIVTVPNESGIVFLLKHLIKSMFKMNPDVYSPKELYYALTYQAEKIKRNQHKGFDWRELRELLQQHFVIKKTEGLPFITNPYFSFQIGFICQIK